MVYVCTVKNMITMLNWWVCEYLARRKKSCWVLPSIKEAQASGCTWAFLNHMWRFSSTGNELARCWYFTQLWLLYMQPQVCLSQSSNIFLSLPLPLSHTQGDCITAALECFQIELKGTVRLECEYPEENIRQAVEFLDFAIRQRSRDVNATVSTSTQCFDKLGAKGKEKMTATWNLFKWTNLTFHLFCRLRQTLPNVPVRDGLQLISPIFWMQLSL